MLKDTEFMEVRMRTSCIKMVTFFLAADQLLRSAKLPEQNKECIKMEMEQTHCTCPITNWYQYNNRISDK